MAQYNVLQPPPTSKREMLNNATAKSVKPSNSCAFPVNPHSSYKTLFVRTPTTPDTGDRRLYDQCDFHLATEGMQASVGSIGELSVMAVFQFSKPTLSNIGVPFDLFNWNEGYTPNVIGNNVYLLSFFNGGNTEIVQPPNTGSTLGGEMKQDDVTGNFNYYFSDAADSVLGAIFEVEINAKLDADASTTASFYWMHMKESIDVTVWEFNNCERVNYLTSPGYTVCDTENPGLVASIVITPTPATTPPDASEGTVGYSTNFFVRITGPNASFGVRTDTANYLNWRWFLCATGVPTLPTSQTNPRLFRRMTVTQVAMG
jgi:hypothetical protein